VVNGVVNGTAAATAQPDSSGKITFTVHNAATSGAAGSCVVPVVYQDKNGDTALNTGTSSANAPATEPFGVGGNAQFTPSAAPAGTSGTFFIASIDKTANTFTGCSAENRATATFSGTCYQFAYKSGDQFWLQPYNSGSLSSSSLSEFQKNATPYDEVDVGFIGSYSPTATSNAFALVDTDPIPPADNGTNSSTVTATAGTTSPNAATTPYNTVIVRWTDSDTPTTSSYNVYRATWVSPASACPTYPNTTPAAGTSTYSMVGTVADSDPAVANGATKYTFTDTGLSDNTNYCYVISAVDSGNEHLPNSTTAASTAVGTATTAPTPKSIASSITQGSNVGNNVNALDNGDTFAVQFDRPVTVAATTSLTLVDKDGTTATVTCGTNATCTGSGTSVLNVALTSNLTPSTLGTDGVITTSTNPVAVLSETGVTNAVGAWNLPGSGVNTAGVTRVLNGTNAGLPAAATVATATAGTNSVSVTGAAANSTVTVYDANGNALGSATADGTGAATVTLSRTLVSGETIQVVYVAPTAGAVAGQPSQTALKTV